MKPGRLSLSLSSFNLLTGVNLQLLLLLQRGCAYQKISKFFAMIGAKLFETAEGCLNIFELRPGRWHMSKPCCLLVDRSWVQFLALLSIFSRRARIARCFLFCLRTQKVSECLKPSSLVSKQDTFKHYRECYLHQL